MDPYVDSLIARGIISPRAAEQLAAQQARNAAATRTRQAVQPEQGRQEGAISQWIDDQGQRLVDQIGGAVSDIMAHPEHLVGPGELGIARVPFWAGRPDLLARAKDLAAQGKPYAQIAKELNVPVGTVTNKLWREGISSGNPSGVRTPESFDTFWTRNPDAEARLQDLVDQGKSYSAIAKELGISRGAVAGKLDRQRNAGTNTAATAPGMTDWEIGPEGTMTRQTKSAAAESQVGKSERFDWPVATMYGKTIDMPISVNPSRFDIARELAKYGDVRALKHPNGDLYMWPANEAMHVDIANSFDMPFKTRAALQGNSYLINKSDVDKIGKFSDFDDLMSKLRNAAGE